MCIPVLIHLWVYFEFVQAVSYLQRTNSVSIFTNNIFLWMPRRGGISEVIRSRSGLSITRYEWFRECPKPQDDNSDVGEPFRWRSWGCTGLKVIEFDTLLLSFCGSSFKNYSIYIIFCFLWISYKSIVGLSGLLWSFKVSKEVQKR